MTKEDKTRDFMKRIPGQLFRFEYNDLVRECHEYFPHLPMSVFEFTNDKYFFRQREYGGINLVYRARKNNNPNGSPWNKISEIDIIPKHKWHDEIKKFGRVNKPGHGIFYGSFEPSVACSEAFSKGNAFEFKNSLRVTAGIWQFTTPMTFVEIPRSIRWYNYLYSQVSFKPEKLLAHHIEEKNNKIKQQINNDHGYDLLMFFADEFAKIKIETHLDYQLCNYFADRVFNRFSNFDDHGFIDGIVYPSITLSYEHLNVAIRPESLHKLKFLRATDYAIFKPSTGGINFNPFLKGTADVDGNLKWGR